MTLEGVESICPQCEGSGFYRSMLGDEEAVYTCEDCIDGLVRCFPSLNGSTVLVAVADMVRRAFHRGYLLGRKSVNSKPQEKRAAE